MLPKFVAVTYFREGKPNLTFYTENTINTDFVFVSFVLIRTYSNVKTVRFFVLFFHARFKKLFNIIVSRNK